MSDDLPNALTSMQTRFSTEERQAEIVEAALRLARKSSPALITTGDIAAAIGVKIGRAHV